MQFGKDFTAEQRASVDAMNLGMDRTYGNNVASNYADVAATANQTSGMDSSFLNQDRSLGNSEGAYMYNAIRDEAIKPNNVLNGYLGIQEIPNLMANGSSIRGSRGNINNPTNDTNTNTLTDAEFNKGKNKFIQMLTPYSDINMRNGFEYTVDDDSGEYKISDIPPDMMSNGSNIRGRGNRNFTTPLTDAEFNTGKSKFIDMLTPNTYNLTTNESINQAFDDSGEYKISPLSSLGRDVASGMGDGLNNVMRMTENIQSKYGDPNDKTIDQIMAEYNVDNAENAFQGMDNNRGLLQRMTDNFRQNEIDMKVLYDTNPNYQVSPSYGEAKGMNVNNFSGFGRTGLADIPVVGNVLDNAIGGAQTAAMFGGDLLYQGIQAAKDKNKSFSNVIPSAYEQAKGYAQARFDPSIDTSSAKSMFDAAQSLESQPNADALRIAKQKEAGTFQPGKKAQAYEPITPVVKPKVKVNYNRNKPVVVKSKPVRTPQPKPTRSTGSRGGRGNVAKRSAAKKSTPSKSYSNYSRRVGGR